MNRARRVAEAALVAVVGAVIEVLARLYEHWTEQP